MQKPSSQSRVPDLLASTSQRANEDRAVLRGLKPGSCTLGELMERVGFVSSARIRRLERYGLLAREKHQLQLTDGGRKIAEDPGC